MDRFTPGPWNIFGPNVLETFTIHTDSKARADNQICQTRLIGNARLICKAPEMYELLKKHLHGFCGNDLLPSLQTKKLLDEIDSEGK